MKKWVSLVIGGITFCSKDEMLPVAVKEFSACIVPSSSCSLGCIVINRYPGTAVSPQWKNRLRKLVQYFNWKYYPGPNMTRIHARAHTHTHTLCLLALQYAVSAILQAFGETNQSWTSTNGNTCVSWVILLLVVVDAYRKSERPKSSEWLAESAIMRHSDSIHVSL